MTYGTTRNAPLFLFGKRLRRGWWAMLPLHIGQRSLPPNYKTNWIANIHETNKGAWGTAGHVTLLRRFALYHWRFFFSSISKVFINNLLQIVVSSTFNYFDYSAWFSYFSQRQCTIIYDFPIKLACKYFPRENISHTYRDVFEPTIPDGGIVNIAIVIFCNVLNHCDFPLLGK